jgi:biopolymer transport protein ExbD
MTETKPNINITPLIDILLVLLIIFMVISPNKPADFKTKIPSEPTKQEVTPNPDSLVVKINNDYSLNLNHETNLGSVSDTNTLIKRLTSVFQLRKENLNNEKSVFIKAPKNLQYGEIVKVVDALKISGANPIALQIDNLD